jgi:hypothetical protein
MGVNPQRSAHGTLLCIFFRDILFQKERGTASRSSLGAGIAQLGGYVGVSPIKTISIIVPYGTVIG